MQLPFEFRCVHCHFEEEVLVKVKRRRDEGEGMAYDRAARALSFYRCRRCGKRDLASIALRSLLFFLLGNAGLVALWFLSGVEAAGYGEGDVPFPFDPRIAVPIVEVVLLVVVVVRLRNSGEVRPRSMEPPPDGA